MQNMFAESVDEKVVQKQKLSIVNYDKSEKNIINTVSDFFVGFVCGVIVFYVFYKVVIVSLIGGIMFGTYNFFAGRVSRVEKRKFVLRTQFLEFLEAMGTSLRAGNPVPKAIGEARNDLGVIYPDKSDIIRELDLMIARFNNGIILSDIFEDLAVRSELEDIKNFASVYKTIEGKSSRVDEIIRETQQIIADKMEIELEIETLMASAKSEVNIMLFMPVAIILLIDLVGGGFMDVLYSSMTGKVVSTFGLIMFFICFLLATAFSKIDI